MGFVSCHNHSMYSNLRLRDALGSVPEMIEYAHNLGYKGLAFTEHECITSALEANKFYYAHKDLPEWKDFKVILGNEIYLCTESTNTDNRGNNVFPHFILLAKDAIGHQQIRELSTIAWSHSFRDFMTRVPLYYSDLEEKITSNRGHVIGTSACLGSALSQRILQLKEHPDYYDSCKEWISYIKEIFGEGNFFLEMQPALSENQITVNKTLLRLSHETNTPYIITTDTHYLRKEDKKIHAIFLKADDNENGRETEDFYDYTYMMSEEEIHTNMDEYIGAENVQRGIDNTQLIYNMIEDYDLRKPLHIPYIPLNKEEPDENLYKKWVDKIPLIDYFYHSEYDSDRHMIRDVLKHLDTDVYYQNEKGYKAISDCLNDLKISSETMNVRWSAYLMQIADYVNIAWDCDTLVAPSRGSGGGFCLLNMLGITQINPLREKTQTYHWRFLNPYRASVLDIDSDIEPSKKDNVLQGLKNVYGEDRVSKVMTLSTEGTRSAILSVARALEIDNDEAQYISSLVVADRGISRTLHQMYYGDEANDFKPIPEFIHEMDLNPELWDAAQKIEGVITGVGSHAGGVIIVDEPFTNTTALMKTNSGDVITQFDLHQCEDVSLIKIDLLCTDAMGKIRAELDLLLKDKVIEWQGSLRKTYEKYLGIYTLERDDPKMWDYLLQHKVISFFQMEKESGYKAIAIGQPKSVDDLAALNSVMRLMAQEKGKESPLDKYGRFRKDINEWYKEMDEAGLTKEEEELLKPILISSYGICQSQEQLMMLVQIPEVGGFDLVWADKLRKAVAKKVPKAFTELEKEFFQNAENKKLSKNLVNYVWKVLVCTQRGYGFNSAHTLAYSLIGLQELNLYYKYNPIYWACANLIVDSGSIDEEGDNKSTKYDKIAIAINEVKEAGIEVTNPLINEAEFGYKPDIPNNRIIVGLKSINGVGDDVAQAILLNKPYASMEDFCTRMVETKIVTPAQMIALIKAGSFNMFFNSDKVKAMNYYLKNYVFTECSKLTFSQFKKITELGIVPEELKIYVRYYNFRKYVLDDEGFVKNIINEGKKIPKCGYHDRIFILDDNSQPFYKEYFNEECVKGVSGKYYLISEKEFDKMIENKLQPLKEWFVSIEAINSYNKASFNELYQSKASGDINEWSMSALSYYDNEHELAHINEKDYGVINYFDLPEEPNPYDYYTKYIKGVKRVFPKLEIKRIMGTVIAVNKSHCTVTLLTTHGAVNVKFNKGQFSFYNKRISVIGDDGKKTVVEEGWFKRGTLLIVSGYRQESIFRAYRYSDTIYTHTLSLISEVKEDNTLEVQNERTKV